ncbi:two-CW domain-containing protein [Candidatus Riflebacteria bacterium]
MKKNCWEVQNCGREPDGAKVSELGVCPVFVESEHCGKNEGENAGRCCWRVAGTFCSGKVQGSFSTKMLNCASCEVFIRVKQEEGDKFEA